MVLNLGFFLKLPLVGYGNVSSTTLSFDTEFSEADWSTD